jgi:hypothetical protein
MRALTLSIALVEQITRRISGSNARNGTNSAQAQHIGHTPVAQLGQHVQPVLRALTAVTGPQPEDVTAALTRDRQRDVVRATQRPPDGRPANTPDSQRSTAPVGCALHGRHWAVRLASLKSGAAHPALTTSEERLHAIESELD